MTPADRIRRAVEAALPKSYGGLERWDGPVAGEWSWTFRAETRGPGPATLLVKVPRWDEAPDLASALAAGPQRDTAEEFAALQAIAAAVAAAGDPGLAAVVPVAYVDEVNAIVMELLRAEPLSRRLQRRPDPSQIASLFRRSGRWLRTFHGISGTTAIPFSDDPGEIERLGRAVPALARAAAAIAAATRRLQGRETTAVVAHGDFSMANILVTIDDRIAAVDPNRSRSRSTADIAHVLTEARLSRRQLLSAGIGRSPGTVDTWAASLIEGYGEIDRVVLSYDRAVAAVRRWAELEESLRGWQRVALVPARRLLRSEIERLLGAV